MFVSVTRAALMLYATTVVAHAYPVIMEIRESNVDQSAQAIMIVQRKWHALITSVLTLVRTLAVQTLYAMFTITLLSANVQHLCMEMLLLPVDP